ncbi:MAG: hypothetical protein NT150_02975 [Bacteroidetes bacterium]|nr:hypothetical protein [Bacteroidota bacterium]
MLKKNAIEIAIYDKIEKLDEARAIGDSVELFKVANILNLKPLPVNDSIGRRVFSVKLMDLSVKFNEFTLAYIVPFRKKVFIFTEKPLYIQNYLLENTAIGAEEKTYIVGPDFRMRATSGELNVKNPMDVFVQNESVKLAITAQNGQKMTKDRDGNIVLSAYNKIKIKGMQWAIVSEAGEDQVVQSIIDFRNKLIGFDLIFIALVYFISYLISKKIVNAIRAKRERMKLAAEKK